MTHHDYEEAITGYEKAIKAQEALITDLQEQVEKLTKTVADERASKDYWQKENYKNIEIINSIHFVMDKVPSPPPRDDSASYPEGTDSWKFHIYTLAERFAIWLSNVRVNKQ